MYLLGLSLIYCFLYFFLFFAIPFVLSGRTEVFRFKFMISIAYIIGIYFAVLVASFLVSDVAIGNRILHTFGGGFLVVLTCFFVVKDSRINISRLQFFILTVLISTFFGVVNEIGEYVLQTYGYILFAVNVQDTWLDLISNTVGAVLAATGLLFLLPINSLPNRPK